MPEITPSVLGNNDWEPAQELMLGRVVDYLHGLGYDYVRVLSDHIGWGRPSTSTPYCTNPHYILADRLVIRVSLPRLYCLALETSHTELLPTLRPNCRELFHDDPADIPANDFHYELMSYRRGRLYIYVLPLDCRSRLCAQNALTNRRSLFRAAGRKAEIMAAVHQGRVPVRHQGSLSVSPSFV